MTDVIITGDAALPKKHKVKMCEGIFSGGNRCNNAIAYTRRPPKHCDECKGRYGTTTVKVDPLYFRFDWTAIRQACEFFEIDISRIKIGTHGKMRPGRGTCIYYRKNGERICKIHVSPMDTAGSASRILWHELKHAQQYFRGHLDDGGMLHHNNDPGYARSTREAQANAVERNHEVLPLCVPK